MNPFHRARESAEQLRRELFGETAKTAISSKVLIEAVAHEDGEDFEISPAHPADAALGGADAVLLRQLRQVIVRNDVTLGERAFLVAHEFGHWKLHLAEHAGCHKIVDSDLKPQEGETFGAQK